MKERSNIVAASWLRLAARCAALAIFLVLCSHRAFGLALSDIPPTIGLTVTRIVNVQDFEAAITVDKTGNVYVAANSHNGSDGDFLTIKLNADGNVQWTAVHDTGSFDRARGIAVDHFGNVYVTGETLVGQFFSILTLKYDSNGSLIWSVTFDESKHDMAYGVTFHPPNNVYVNGESQIGVKKFIRTIKYDSDGRLEWTTTNDGGGIGFGRGVGTDGKGNVYVTGKSLSDVNWDFRTIKYQPDGNLIWSVSFNGSSIEGAEAVVVNKAGNVYVCGNTDNGSDQDIRVIKYDSNGTVIWTAVFDSGVDELGHSIAVSKSGNVYVTGQKIIGTNSFFLTLKYDSQGTLIWTTTDSGSVGDIRVPGGQGVAVNDLGHVYVVGYVDGPGEGSKLRIVKYVFPTGLVKSLGLEAPQATPSDIAFSLTVTAKDQFGNAVTNYHGTVAFTSTDPLAQLPADFKFTKADAGIHVFSATLATGGDQTVTVQDVTSAFGPSAQSTIEVLVLESEFVVIPGASVYRDIDFFGPQVGWVVGSDDTLGPFKEPFTLRFDGSTWTRIDGVPAVSGCVAPIPAAVGLSSPDIGFMAAQGICGRDSIPHWFQYELSGQTWLGPLEDEVDAGPGGLTMVSQQDGWQAVCLIFFFQRPEEEKFCGIFRFDGSNFVFFDFLFFGTFEFPSVFEKIRFVREQPAEGWAVDNNGDLFRFIEGDTWRGFLQSSMLGLWMNAPDDVWACGFNGTILKFDGTAWGSFPTPPEVADADLNAVSFFDPNHGVAVGGRDPSSLKEEPVILSFTGQWNSILVTPPSNLTDVRLTGVRMIAQDEAWAIGAATDLDTSQTIPILLRIRLPGSHGAEGFPPVTAQPLEAPGPLSITALRAAVDSSGDGNVTLRFGVTESCEATLTVLDSTMRPVRKFTLSAVAGENEVVWDGREEGGDLVLPGWYLARLEVRNKHGTAIEGEKFLLVLPKAVVELATQESGP